MEEHNKRIVIDIDGTICSIKGKGDSYELLEPIESVVVKLKEYKEKGFYIILYTSRNMNSFKNNIGKINANTAPILCNWLNKYNIPFDELHFGKPWCGEEGFYVDDKAIRPSEFENLSFLQIKSLLQNKS